MSSKRDYYEVLEVERSASQEEIRRAYRRLARNYHPDVNKSPEAEARFKEINEAYQVLSDPEKRAAYDRFGHAGPLGPLDTDFGFGGFSDIFEDFFSSFGFRRERARQVPTRGEDLRLDLTISLEEAAFGCEKEIEVSRLELCSNCGGSGAQPGTTPIRCPECNGTGQVRRVQQSILGSLVNVSTCPRCHGQGEVVISPCRECHGQMRTERVRKMAIDIPAGVETGTSLRLAEQGEAGIYGGPAGNLYVNITVREHPFFQRVDNDILLELPINFAQAALGTEVEVPTLEGKETITIPAGTQSGETLRLKGKGIPYLRRNGRGDQLMRVQVVIPTRLTEKQKELLRELAKTLSRSSPPPNKKGSPWYRHLEGFRD